MSGLDDERHRPPQARGEQCNAKSKCGTDGLLDGHLVKHDDREGKPEHHRQPRVEKRGGVDRTDRCSDQTDHEWVTPASAAKRAHAEGHQPRQGRPGQHEHGDTSRVGQRVGREQVDKARHERGTAAPAEDAAEEDDAQARHQQDRADPQPLCDPVRRPDRLEEPEPGPHRPEVPDRLMGDRAQRPIRIPQRRGRRQHRTRVEVEVVLGVGDDKAAAGQEEWKVGNERQRDRPCPAGHNGPREHQLRRRRASSVSRPSRVAADESHDSRSAAWRAAVDATDHAPSSVSR